MLWLVGWLVFWLTGLSCSVGSAAFLVACRTFSGGSHQTLSCGMWDIVPLTRGSNLGPLLGAQSPSHWTPREVYMLWLK